MDLPPYGKITKCSLADLIEYQIAKNGNFKRVDIIVKYMAIESYIEGEDIGLSLYRKMYKKLFPRMKDKTIDNRLLRLRKLIELIKKERFDTKMHPLSTTTKMHIWDGAHRMACAMYFGHDFMYVKRIKKEFKRGSNLGKKRMEKVFDPQEMSLIEKKQKEVFRKLGIKRSKNERN